MSYIWMYYYVEQHIVRYFKQIIACDTSCLTMLGTVTAVCHTYTVCMFQCSLITRVIKGHMKMKHAPGPWKWDVLTFDLNLTFCKRINRGKVRPRPKVIPSRFYDPGAGLPVWDTFKGRSSLFARTQLRTHRKLSMKTIFLGK